MNTYRTKCVVVFVIAGTTAVCAYAQYLPKQKKPASYSSYFNRGQNYIKSQNLNRYLYNKYYYHNKNVSPYINLYRRDPVGGSTAYYRWVVPEQKRRAAAAKRQQFTTQAQPNFSRVPAQIGTRNRPAAARTAGKSQYYNQWYGSAKYRR